MNLGMNVYVKFHKELFKDVEEDIFYNVTEIHYNYRKGIEGTEQDVMVAFESGIHATGSTWRVKDLVEFEAILADKKAPAYQL